MSELRLRFCVCKHTERSHISGPDDRVNQCAACPCQGFRPSGEEVKPHYYQPFGSSIDHCKVCFRDESNELHLEEPNPSYYVSNPVLTGDYYIEMHKKGPYKTMAEAYAAIERMTGRRT